MKLYCDDHEIASLTIASSHYQKFKGLMGTRKFDGALLFTQTRSVHTFFMLYSIDVAFCDDNLDVLSIERLDPFRLSKPVPNCVHTLEAMAGSFERWWLQPGSRLRYE